MTADEAEDHGDSSPIVSRRQRRQNRQRSSGRSGPLLTGRSGNAIAPSSASSWWRPPLGC